jgi:hypothetical protein
MQPYQRHSSPIIHLAGIGLLGALFACSGEPGAPGGAGASGLVHASTEPAGANCPFGGTRIDVGVDSNGNGALDPTEVSPTATSYVCNGKGQSSLVRTTAEPAGPHCPFAGTRIETGLDADNSGTLDAAEIDAAATSYVCNLAPGGGAISPSTGIVAAIAPGGVSTATTGPITVRFTLKDDRGFPLDLGGSYSQNTPIQPRFAIGYFTKDATTGIVSPLTMYTQSTSAAAPAGQPTSYSPLTSTGQGTLIENGLGAGDYTYTFPTTATTNGATYF